MPREKSPDEVASKWSRNLAAAEPSVRAGVEAVTESPTEKAAERSREWQEGVSSERARARFEAGLRRVSLADWKAKFLANVGRIGAGARLAEDDYRDFMSDFLAHVYPARDRIMRENPGIDLESGIARMTAMVRHNAAYERKR